MLAPLFNVSMVISLMMVAPAFITGEYWMLVFPVMFLAYALTMLILGLKDAVFPYSRIGFYPAAEDQRKKYELWAVTAWVLVTVICVSGTLLLM